MDGTIGAAVVAAASGLAVLAYRHPSGYKRLSRILTVIYGVVTIIMLSWSLAVARSLSVVELVTDPKEHKRIEDALETVTAAGWVSWSLIAAMLYIWALELLPYFTTSDDRDKNSN